MLKVFIVKTQIFQKPVKSKNTDFTINILESIIPDPLNE